MPFVLPGFALIYRGPDLISTSGAGVSFEITIQNVQVQPITIDVFSDCRIWSG